MLDIMALFSLASALSTLSLVSITFAHIQMINPSPLRDPHADRPNEPKDWNILMPLHDDGSDFACKGFQWNTPWTTTATYEAGKTYNMELKGGATHGGGSCQLSLSFDRGVNFRVIKSIEGGCPEQKQYSFTVPPELGKGLGSKRTTGLFAWTWFNRLGNREMYMNCAVVDIVSPGNKDRALKGIDTRDASQANAAAQAALSSYPQLFVANLAGINTCVTRETVDVIFDNPGPDITFADGESASSNPSFKKGECTGEGKRSAGDSTSSSAPLSPPSLPVGSSPGDDGKWHGDNGHQQQQSTNQASSSIQCNDGQYHEECFGKPVEQQAGSKTSTTTPAQQDPPAFENQSGGQKPADSTTGQKLSSKQEDELDEYLEKIHGKSVASKQEEPASELSDDAEQAAPTPIPQERVADPSAQNDVSAQPASEPEVHFFAPWELSTSSSTGEDSPISYYPKKDSEYMSYYEDIYALPRLAKLARCQKITTNVKRCRKPNRWVKQTTCTWVCGRKGRVVEKPTLSPKRIEKKLGDLERLFSDLVNIVSKSRKNQKNRKQRAGKRQHGAVDHFRNITRTSKRGSDVDTANIPDAADPMLNLFLTHLERLQDNVIKCIRYIASRTASDSTFGSMNGSLRVNATSSSLVTSKRSPTPSGLEQLQVDLNDYVQQLESFRSGLFHNNVIPTSHEGVGKRKRQLLPPNTDTNDIPAFAFSQYAYALTSAIATTIDTWLQGLGPLVHEVAAQLLEYDPEAPFNISSIPTGNYTGYDTSAISAALDAWLEALDVVVGEGIKQSLEPASPPPEGRPAYNFTRPFTNRTQEQTNKLYEENLETAAVKQQHGKISYTAEEKNKTGKPEPDNVEDISLLLGPGPVLPPGVHVDWTGPNHPGEGNLENMPALVDDLGPESAEEVRKWFADVNDDKEDSDEDEEEMRTVKNGGEGLWKS